jgi:hypothetical protein
MVDDMDLSKIIKTPEAWDLESFKDTARENLFAVYDLSDDPSKQIPFNEFLENADHGLEHIYHVYHKALQIADEVEQKENVTVDKTLLYVMSAMHDSGRFRTPIINLDDTEQQQQAKHKKRKKAESDHPLYGKAQILLAKRRLKEKWIIFPSDQREKIEDYLLNHDFFSDRMDGQRHKEPQSLEWQIVRLSDRISVPVEDEIVRYRAAGKRLGTPYFKDDISFQERVSFTFDTMKQYIQIGKFDEFMFFLALLSNVPSDFSDKTLQEIYRRWSGEKRKWIQKILDLAKQEWYAEDDIQKMKDLIEEYLLHFTISLESPWE